MMREDAVCRVLAADFLARLVLLSFLGCNQTLETNFCSRYFIIATYKNPPQVCCGFCFCFFSGRNSNVQNRGFVFCRYKRVEGTTTYATKDVELCCV